MAYAPESGSETTRRLIKKKMKTDRLLSSIKAAAAAQLNVSTFMVIGFPHDTPGDIAANLPFIDQLIAAGVTDFIVGFYMALPGTELFESLYDAGKVRIDRRYFQHMLQQSALAPSQSYCDRLNRAQLSLWKVRLMLTFYRRKGRASQGAGLTTSLKRAVHGLGGGAHNTKLETAFRHGVFSAWNTVKTACAPGWMPMAEERRMFESWDAIYRSIRERKRAAGALAAIPTDTTELYQRNVVTALRQDHETNRTFPVLRPTASPVPVPLE